MKVNFESIAVDVLPRAESICQQLLPGGKRKGHEFVAGNLQGDPGESLSVNLDTGKWGDFAEGAKGGDLISLVAAVKSCSQKEAAEWLVGDLTPYITGAGNSTRASDKFEPILPAPSEIADPSAFNHPKLGSPSAVYTYRDPEGRLLNYILRFQPPGKKKEFAAVTYGTVTDKEGNAKKKWWWKQIPDKRPLYGLERINQEKRDVAILVEGEKAADALRPLFKQTPILTWPGGSQAVKKADFKPLQGFKRLILWPDNDEPGRSCMEEIATKLQGKVGRLQMLDVAELGEKEDAADLVAKQWTKKQIFDFVQERAADWHPKMEDKQEAAAQGEFDYQDMEPGKEYKIIPLGYNHGHFYYFPSTGKQVVCLTPSAHTSANLLQLAPLGYWKARFATKYGISWLDATNWLIQQCYAQGIYDDDKIRGRGAWWDDGRVVMHLGDVLMVDGQAMYIEDFKSRYIYERAKRIDFDIYSPLKASECQLFMDICKRARWENELSAFLLAGWCVLAPVCGALKWRPHIWLTGAAGSGKTWIMNNIIHKVLEGFALNIVHETTQAGIRQELGIDALPVIFDEVKGEERGEQERIQSVLGLMRQASSETGAKIIKGSSTGVSKIYRIRSSFVLASVGLGIKQHADETRISVLGLRTPNINDKVVMDLDKARYAELAIKSVGLTEEYMRRMVTRTISLIPIIRKNAETFALAAAAVLGTQRAGDQVGTLLAGAYSLYSAKEISPEAAMKWIEERDIVSTAPDSEPDDARCLNHLLQYIIRLQDGKGTHERTVGELVELALGIAPYRGEGVNISEAEESLARRGIRVEQSSMSILVANSHGGLAEIFRNTPWRQNWDKTLKQSLSADNYENKSFRFSGQVVQKVTRVRLAGNPVYSSSSSQPGASLSPSTSSTPSLPFSSSPFDDNAWEPGRE